MESDTALQPIAENLWIMHYSLRLLGMNAGRTVTLIRLRNGKLKIHSTAPFTSEEAKGIRALGEPAWLMDVTRFHDSFAAEGRAAFPEVDYLVPDGFPHAEKLGVRSLDSAPTEWAKELEIRKLDGMPKVQEHVLFHVPSRTLIVADMLFHFPPTTSGWTRFVARHFLRLKDLTGMSPFFRFMIKDRAAFRRSLAEILTWDFERIIVAHGDSIRTDARSRIEEILKRLPGD